jgi:hypothetical protein
VGLTPAREAAPVTCFFLFIRYRDNTRAIATRYDKTKCNFLAALHLVASAILLN